MIVHTSKLFWGALALVLVVGCEMSDPATHDDGTGADAGTGAGTEYAAFSDPWTGTEKWMFRGVSQSELQANPVIGGRMKLRRSYEKTLPATYGGQAKLDTDRNIIPWVSFTGTPTAANLHGWLTGAKATGKRIILTFDHEVDHGPKMTATAFKDVYALAAQVRNQVGATNVKLAPILTAGPFRDGSYAQWFGADNTYDFVGIDPYRFWRPAGAPPDPKVNGLGQDRTMQYLVGQGPAFAAAHHKRIALGEWGAHPRPEDPTERGSWLIASDAFLVSVNCAAAAYFHSPNGESGPWYVDRYHFTSGGKVAGDADPDSLAAFASRLH